MDNINLFSIITIMSFFILAPVTLLLEGVKFTPSAMQSMGIVNSTEIIKKTLLAGVCFHAYQQVSDDWLSSLLTSCALGAVGSTLLCVAFAKPQWVLVVWLDIILGCIVKQQPEIVVLFGLKHLSACCYMPC